ncbi:hypothetical protein [Acinetobacter baumannii]
MSLEKPMLASCAWDILRCCKKDGRETSCIATRTDVHKKNHLAQLDWLC